MNGPLRFAMIALRRFTVHPAAEDRAAASRLLLTSAIRLHAQTVSTGEASVACAETIAQLARAERGARHACAEDAA